MLPNMTNKNATVQIECSECGANYFGRPARAAKYPGLCDRCRRRRRNNEKRAENPQKWDEAAKRSAARHRAAVSELKMRMGCSRCGYAEHPAALDFDHTDGKTTDVGKLRSMKAVLAEIERHKCVVLCANCHRVKTWERKQQSY